MRVSITEAAKELGINPQAVRMRMLDGTLNIGKVMPNTKGTGQRFLVYRHMLDSYLGKNSMIEESPNVTNQMFYASCVSSGILSAIRREINKGTTEDHTKEFKYAIRKYENEIGTSSIVLEEELDLYQEALKERKMLNEFKNKL